eukprot:7314816-Prymnesium_polylepis.1
MAPLRAAERELALPPDLVDLVGRLALARLAQLVCVPPRRLLGSLVLRLQLRLRLFYPVGDGQPDDRGGHLDIELVALSRLLCRRALRLRPGAGLPLLDLRLFRTIALQRRRLLSQLLLLGQPRAVRLDCSRGVVHHFSHDRRRHNRK